MIVFVENSRDESTSGIDIRHIEYAARVSGVRVFRIPVDFESVGGVEDALWNVREQDTEALAIWVGYMIQSHQYEAIYDGLRTKNIRLLNSPDEHVLSEQFHRFYPFIEDLTPASVVVEHPGECLDVTFTYPVFVKGTVQSLKIQGPSRCIANSLTELESISRQLLRHDRRTLNKVIVREYVALRHTEETADGFPLGREFRVFLYNHEVLATGYYWEGDHDPLTEEETSIVEDLAREVSRRLGVPYIAVDIGQLDTGQWIVIEVGDAQFAGLSQVPVFKIWNQLSQIA